MIYPKVALEELFKVGSSKRVLQSQWTKEGVPFYRGREITKLTEDGYVKNDLFISEALYSEYTVKYGVPCANDIMITAIGTIGNSYIVKEDDRFYFKDASVLWLKKTAVVDSHFVNWWLKSTLFTEQLERGNGATVDTLTISKLQKVQINIPPLAEQARIVSVLDQAFEHIATAKAAAQTNLANAKALFESHLQAVFSQRGEGWVETTLEKATGGIFTGPFGSLLHKSDYVTNGIPLVNPAHITDTGIEHDPFKTISKVTLAKLKSYVMSEGDIVIGRRGEMGRCAAVTSVENGWLCGTGSFFIKSSPSTDTRYLVRFLRSNACKTELEKIAGGSVMPNLSNSDLSSLQIYLPPLNEQQKIVQGIEHIHEQTRQLEALYQAKLSALDALKQSLLHQAFSGAL